VVSFVPQGKSVQLEVGWTPEPVWCSEEENYCQELNPSHPTHSLVTIVAELPWLLAYSYIFKIMGTLH